MMRGKFVFCVFCRSKVSDSSREWEDITARHVLELHAFGAISGACKECMKKKLAELKIKVLDTTDQDRPALKLKRPKWGKL